MNTLEKILEEIEEKIKFAEKIIVKPPCDKLDEIANDTAEAFIEAYKECVEIIRSHMDDVPKCGECSRRKWYQIGYEDAKKEDDWIPVSERLPEVPEGKEDADCPEFNVTIKGADKATTLKYSPDGTWFDDSGEVYNVEAWKPLPEAYKGGTR